MVIIGNGVAGTTAAELLRADSASCQIDIIARESHQFYNRMALGRVMHSRTGLDGLHMMPPQWFEQRRINVWLNTLVVGIDSGASRVRLGTGQALPYDRLILAQGAEAAIPNMPGATLRGTFVLRSADDASAIRAWSQTRRCLEAVVVGGGILGVETASALQSLGLRVTILHRNNRLLDRHLDGKGAGILARFLGGTGIDVRLGVDVRAAVGGGDGHLASIELATGEQVPAQICVFCIGIKPDTGLAKAAGLAINRGVVVYPTMRTSVPAIAAIGDMAEPPGGRSGLWTEGVRQAEVAIAAMLAKPDAGTAAPSSVQLKIAGIDAQAFGRLDAGEPGDRVFVNAADDDDEHRRIVIRDGRLIGAVSVGPPGTGRQFAALAALNFDLAAVEEGIARGDWRRSGVQEIII